MRDIIFINSHPIQYFAPLYKYMNEHGCKTTAWYCSDESIRGVRDRQFGVDVKWDIPLLEGYTHRFFKNYSWKPSQGNGFLGLMNFGMVSVLFRIPKSVIVVHGWNYLTHFLVIMFGKLKGHTVCLRCEMPQNQELMKKGLKMKLKRIMLKYLVFPSIDYFLYIGSQNRMFYKSYGIADEKLLFAPYAVDNGRFKNESTVLKPKISEIRQRLGIPATAKVILYSGKYMAKKRPMDVLEAFNRLGYRDAWLVMLGEGELRGEIEQYMALNKLSNVILTGFINQSLVSEYYSISDVFVMCSTVGETWGLSVNEAMNFGLPVIVSETTGSSYDLVVNGENGYTFETGNIEQLTARLNDVLFFNKLSNISISEKLLDIYSYKTISDNIRSIVS